MLIFHGVIWVEEKATLASSSQHDCQALLTAQSLQNCIIRECAVLCMLEKRFSSSVSRLYGKHLVIILWFFVFVSTFSQILIACWLGGGVWGSFLGSFFYACGFCFFFFWKEITPKWNLMGPFFASLLGNGFVALISQLPRLNPFPK